LQEADAEEQRGLKAKAKAWKEGKGEVWTEEDDSHRWCEDEDGPFRVNSAGGWSINEMLSHPLFIKPDCIPSDPRDFEANYPLVAALRDMAYDGQSDEEMAEKFNKMGNDAFKVVTNEQTKEAIVAYTKALEMESTDAAANAKYLCNRAAASIRLGEYSKAVDDCLRATELDATNAKAWFRGAQSCERLGLLKRGHRLCCQALELLPEDAEVTKLHQRLVKAIERKAKEDAIAAEKEARRREAEEAREKKVREAILEQGIELGPVLYDVAAYRVKTPRELLPRLDSEGDLEWPLLFIYEEHSQTDFVEFWSVLMPLETMLQQMFPGSRYAAWDAEEKYVWDKVSVYLELYHGSSAEAVRKSQKDSEGETASGKACDTDLLSVDPHRPILELLFNRCVPPCLVLHVLATGSPCHLGWCQRHGLPG